MLVKDCVESLCDWKSHDNVELGITVAESFALSRMFSKKGIGHLAIPLVAVDAPDDPLHRYTVAPPVELGDPPSCVSVRLQIFSGQDRKVMDFILELLPENSRMIDVREHLERFRYKQI